MKINLSAYERFLRFLGVRRIRSGYNVRYLAFPEDFSEHDIVLHRKVEAFTMTRPERIYALSQSIQYIVSNDIPGAFVECGVWKGGSVMAMIYTLVELGAERDIYLFDTFAGMTAPTPHDVTAKGVDASPKFLKLKTSEHSSAWDYASLEEVQLNILSTGYPEHRVHFIKGRVEDTIPQHSPSLISLLRLDTDFYESTRHELMHLFPNIVSRGVLILDDYGHWKGARKAVDEYFAEHPSPILLNRIDFACRVAVKP